MRPAPARSRRPMPASRQASSTAAGLAVRAVPAPAGQVRVTSCGAWRVPAWPDCSSGSPGRGGRAAPVPRPSWTGSPAPNGSASRWARWDRSATACCRRPRAPPWRRRHRPGARPAVSPRRAPHRRTPPRRDPAGPRAAPARTYFPRRRRPGAGAAMSTADARPARHRRAASGERRAASGERRAASPRHRGPATVGGRRVGPGLTARRARTAPAPGRRPTRARRGTAGVPSHRGHGRGRCRPRGCRGCRPCRRRR